MSNCHSSLPPPECRTHEPIWSCEVLIMAANIPTPAPLRANFSTSGGFSRITQSLGRICRASFGCDRYRRGIDRTTDVPQKGVHRIPEGQHTSANFLPRRHDPPARSETGRHSHRNNIWHSDPFRPYFASLPLQLASKIGIGFEGLTGFSPCAWLRSPCYCFLSLELLR